VGLLPHYIVYRHVLRQVADFSHKADALEAKHQDSRPFRNYFVDKLGISAVNSARLTQAAYGYEAEMAANQAKVKALVERQRAEHPNGIDPSKPPPRSTPETAELSAERRAIAEKYVRRLQDQMGLDDFCDMDARIRSTVFLGSQQTIPGSDSSD
jgi:hypothetical protein